MGARGSIADRGRVRPCARVGRWVLPEPDRRKEAGMATMYRYQLPVEQTGETRMSRLYPFLAH